jgi:protein associated with RNAse G/E
MDGMRKPTIYRKRFIPFETVDISGDELLLRTDDVLITRWKAIKPRNDISGGISYTFLKEGYKIGRFYDNDGKFIYWYCDIIDVEYNEKLDVLTLIDLLVDIKLMPDGTLLVLDADELAEALEKELITKEQAVSALRKLDHVLKTIYEGNFPPKICRKEEYWVL